jgi:transposase-like protein
VRWYLRFKLSFRDLVEMMAERGIDLAHTTIMRWIQRYVPEFEKRWNRFACKAGGSWPSMNLRENEGLLDLSLSRR